LENTFTVETRYRIKYTTEQPVPIDDVVASLRALEKLLKRTAPFVEKAYPGIQVIDTQVYISELHAGSLIKEYIVKHVFGGQDNYDQAKACFDNILGDSTKMKAVVGIGVGVLIGVGVSQIMPKGEPSKNTEAYNSFVIQAGNDVNLSGESIQEIVDGIRDKKTLSKEAVDAVHPAKGDNSRIEIESTPTLSLPKEVVAELPEEYEPPQPTEKTEKYENVVVKIYASDRDNNDKGWAGIVVGVAEKRVKLILAETVDPRDLHGKTKISANVSVTSRFSKTKKEYEAKVVEIKSLH